MDNYGKPTDIEHLYSKGFYAFILEWDCCNSRPSLHTPPAFYKQAGNQLLKTDPATLQPYYSTRLYNRHYIYYSTCPQEILKLYNEVYERLAQARLEHLEESLEKAKESIGKMLNKVKAYKIK